MDLTLVNLVAKWQHENHMIEREAEIAELGIEAALEYEQELRERKFVRIATPLLLVIMVIALFMG